MELKEKGNKGGGVSSEETLKPLIPIFFPNMDLNLTCMEVIST